MTTASLTIKPTQCSPSACFACKRSLAKSPQLINLAGQAHRWHPECFKCHICKEPMDALDTCHLYKEKILCRADYLRLRRDNSIKCSRCRWQIGASDWVRRAGKDYVYHLACFNCDICSRQLNTGDQFAIDVQQRGRVVRLLCRLHFSINPNMEHLKSATNTDEDDDEEDEDHQQDQRHQHEASSQHRLTGSQDGGEQQYRESHFGTNQSLIMGQHHRRHQQYLPLSGATSAPVGSSSSASCPLSLNEVISASNLISDDKSGQRSSSSKSSSSSTMTNHHQQSIGLSGSKSKRVRTTFTEDQLSILQNHFHIDSNPDGQDLERIATITGLSKRVTQVWFQNSRARQKKYMIKRKPSSSGSSVGGCGGSGGGSAAGVEGMIGTMVAGLGPNNQVARQFQPHPMFERSSSMLHPSGQATSSSSSSKAIFDHSGQMRPAHQLDKWPSDQSNQSDFSSIEDQMGEESEAAEDEMDQEELEANQTSDEHQSVGSTDSNQSNEEKE